MLIVKLVFNLRSLTPFICFSHIIATIFVIGNVHIACWLHLLLSQGYMFHEALGFNQDIGRWNVTSAIYFVSGVGLFESWSWHDLFSVLLELGALYLLLLLSLKGCSCVHDVCSVILIMLIVIFDAKSHTIHLFFHYHRYDTCVITNIDIARLPLLSQDYMFYKVRDFNQNVGDWNVSSATHFVSCFGLFESQPCPLFGLLLDLGALSLLLLVSLKGCCFVHVCFVKIILLIVIFDVKFSHHSSVFPTSSLRYLYDQKHWYCTTAPASTESHVCLCGGFQSGY